MRSIGFRALITCGFFSLVASTTGCGGSGGSGETFVVVRVARGTAVGGIDRVDLTLTMGGQMVTRTLSETGGGDISLPTDAVFHILHGSGALTVRAAAMKGGAQVLAGSASGTVTRGDTTTIMVTLGMDQQPVDGGVGDGGGPAALAIDKTTQDYGTVVVGQSSAAATFTITNSGGSATGPLTVGLTGGDAAAFMKTTDSCTGMTLQAGATCQVAITYMPTTAGTAAAMLGISGSPGGGVAASLNGTSVTAGALTITPPTLDFGSVVMNQSSNNSTFTVTNTGGTPTGVVATSITGTDASQFTTAADGCAGQTLAASQSCTVSLHFSPTSAGARTGSLTVTATPGGTAVASLTGTGLAPGALTMAPATRDFGTLPIGMASTTLGFTVTNTGGAPTGALATTVTGGNAADFAVTADTCMGTMVAAAATCNVTLRFTPSGGGVRTASLTVTGTPGGSAAGVLTGIGQAPAMLVVTPAPYDFTEIVIGNNATQGFNVRNAGDLPSTVPAASIAGTNASEFSVTNNLCTAALAGGATCTLSVRYTPTSAGSKTAQLNVVAATGGTATSMLMGSAVTSGALTITPNSKDFLGVPIGQATAPQSFTITNTGGSTTGTLTAVVGGAADFVKTADTCTGQTLATTLTCTVSVTFTPAARGARAGTLSVNGSPGGTAQATLNGSGQAAPSLSISPTSKDFMGVVTGQTTTAMFTVTNNGDLASSALATSISSALPAGDTSFTIPAGTNNCGGQTLTGGASCTLVVHFAPASAGAKSATLSVTATTGGSAPANLTGSGVSPGMLTSSVPSLAFGGVLMGQSSDMSFTVSNTGGQTTSALSITTTTANPPASAQFSVLTGMGSDCAVGGTLTGGTSCTVRVHFAPTVRQASITGMVVVSASTGGSAQATLSGGGQAPASLGVSPTTKDFGASGIGVPTTAMFIVSNGGDQTSTAMSTTIGSAVPAGDTSFTLQAGTNSCAGQTLAGAASCSFVVVFTPASAGAKSATVTVSAATGGSSGANLMGSGSSPAVLTRSVASLAFGTLLTTQASDMSFMVTNSGGQTSSAMTITPSTVNPPASPQYSVLGGLGTDCSTVSTLAAGGSCTVRVHFAPNVRQASITGMVVVSATSGGSVTVTLSGGGQAPASLSINPTSFNFMGVTVGTSVTQSFLVTNNGDQSATAISDSFTSVLPAGDTSFTFSSNGCSGAVLVGGGTCTIVVKLNPPSVGNKSATLSVSATTGGSAPAGLSGTGTAASSEPSVTSVTYSGGGNGGASPPNWPTGTWTAKVIYTNASGALVGTLSPGGTRAYSALYPLFTIVVTNSAPSTAYSMRVYRSMNANFTVADLPATQYSEFSCNNGGALQTYCTAGSSSTPFLVDNGFHF